MSKRLIHFKIPHPLRLRITNERRLGALALPRLEAIAIEKQFEGD
jgi:hypothetical protein